MEDNPSARDTPTFEAILVLRQYLQSFQSEVVQARAIYRPVDEQLAR